LLGTSWARAKASHATFTDGLATSINSSNTVTGYATVDGIIRAADGTVTSFEVPGAQATRPQSINDAGTVTGLYSDSSGTHMHAFVRAAGGALSTFDGPDANNTTAVSINNKGEISGRYDNDVHGFLRTAAGELKTFDVMDAVQTVAGCINGKSAITGYFTDNAGGRHGFFRAASGAITTFDVAGASSTFPVCLNDSGVITGSYFDGAGLEGFVRTSDGTVTTFSASDCDMSPTGINRKGVIAGYCQSRARPNQVLGFVRKPDGALKEFHVPGKGQHAAATGINDSGVIAGYYFGGGFLRFP